MKIERVESLHITKTDFQKVLNEMGIKMSINQVDQFFLRSKKYSVSTRSLLLSNEKLEKKATQLSTSSQQDALWFSEILLLTRQSRKQVGVTRINIGDKDWGLLKQLTENANAFCKDFDFWANRREGYKIYINLAMDKMPKFFLPKMIGMHSWLCEIYLAKEEINADQYPSQTTTGHNLYRKLIAEQTGIDQSYEKLPEKFVYFVRAAQIAREYGVSIERYMVSQFEGMAFRSGVPDPAQLVNDGAIERLKKYMYENQMTTNKKSLGIDFSKIRNK